MSSENQTAAGRIFFNGDAAGVDLDGTWDHDNGSDSWDESPIGSGVPGGVRALVEGDVTFVRLYAYGLSAPEIMSLMGMDQLYVPLTSRANISDDEPVNSKSVNLRDFAILADEWLNKLVWPMW